MTNTRAGLRKYKKSLEYLFVPESNKCFKNVGNMFKGHKSQLEGLPLAESGTVES